MSVYQAVSLFVCIKLLPLCVCVFKAVAFGMCAVYKAIALEMCVVYKTLALAMCVVYKLLFLACM